MLFRSISIIIIFSIAVAQEEVADTTVVINPEVSAIDTSSIPIPMGLDSGYKGFPWGNLKESQIPTTFAEIANGDSLAVSKSFLGHLGPDSVTVTYFFADSGFWKVEIDFVIQRKNIEAQLSDFRRLEKNISAVYGPPEKMNQKESGPSGSYSNILEQKFANAFYRSTWSVRPAIIELLLNSSVLLPKSDLSIFSGNFSQLKLVYYNPDYMHSSQLSPAPEVIPSIFDIY